MANPTGDSKKVTGLFLVKITAVFCSGDNRILLNNNTQSFLQDGNPAFFELIFETLPDNGYHHNLIGHDVVVVIKQGVVTNMWYAGEEIKPPKDILTR